MSSGTEGVGRGNVGGGERGGPPRGQGTAAVAGVAVAFPVGIGLALVVEVKYSPPMWVHAVMWPPLLIGLALLLLRFIKSLFVALQYKHRSTSSYD